MDPLTIALAALNAAGTGYNMYEQNRMGLAQNSLGRAQHEAELRSAQNAQSQMQDDMARRRRQLQEALAARGVEDSTIARDDMNYLNRGSDRQMQGANDRVNLASRGLDVFKKQVRSRRRGNYINMGLGLANAIGGAASGFGAAPSVPGV